MLKDCQVTLCWQSFAHRQMDGSPLTECVSQYVYLASLGVRIKMSWRTLQCEVLWTLVCTGTRAHSSWLKATPEIKASLVSPKSTNIARCVVAYHFFHAMRNNANDEINEAILSGDFSQASPQQHPTQIQDR